MIEQGIVPVCLVIISQVELAPAIVLLDQLLSLFDVHSPGRHDALATGLEGRDDFRVEGILVRRQNDLAGPADDDRLAGLTKLLHQSSDQQLVGTPVQVGG